MMGYLSAALTFLILPSVSLLTMLLVEELKGLFMVVALPAIVGVNGPHEVPAGVVDVPTRRPGVASRLPNVRTMSLPVGCLPFSDIVIDTVGTMRSRGSKTT